MKDLHHHSNILFQLPPICIVPLAFTRNTENHDVYRGWEYWSTSQVNTKFAPSSTVYIPLLEGGLKIILEGAGSEDGRSHVNLDTSS